MQLQVDVIVTGGADSTEGQAHFALVHSFTQLGDGFGDVAGTHGAEQLAFVAGLGSDDHSQCGSALTTGLSISQTSSGPGFQFSATGIKVSHVLFSCGNSLALRNQEITAITGLYIDLGTQSTEVLDLLKQNDFHHSSPGLQVVVGVMQQSQ